MRPEQRALTARACRMKDGLVGPVQKLPARKGPGETVEVVVRAAGEPAMTFKGHYGVFRPEAI